MIVVDANLLVYLYVVGQRTKQAEAVLARDPVWAAPLLWRSEFRNTLSGLVRKNALAPEDAIQIVNEAERSIAGREYSVVSHEVLRLAARSGCSAYNCEYVALAQDLGTRLVTGDRQLREAFPAIAIAPEVFAGRQ